MAQPCGALLILGLALLGPALLGRAAAHLTATWRPGVQTFLLTLLALAPAAGGLYTGTIGAWDAAVFGMIFTLACVAPPHVGRPGSVQILTFGLTAELAARLALPAPPRFEGDGDLSIGLFHGRLHSVDACAMMSPSWGAEIHEAPYAHLPAGVPAELHLGDSMLVFGGEGGTADAAASDRFPRLLHPKDGAIPVNLGVAGTSLDAHLLIARQAMDTHDVRRVVQHVFLNNDLSELDRPYRCCPRGHLTTLEPDGSLATCALSPPPVPTWPRLSDWLDRSPPPLVVRTLSSTSAAAAHLRASLLRFTAFNAPWSGREDADDDRLTSDRGRAERAWRHLEALVSTLSAECAARGVDLTFVNLPIGPDLPRADDSPPAASENRRQRWLALMQATGQHHLDATAALDARPPDPAWFQPDGHHLSSAGHARLAAWLDAQLHLAPVTN